MITLLRKLFIRKNSLQKHQRTFVFCPTCDGELISSNSLISDDKFVSFKCTFCKTLSAWDFDHIAPILVDEVNFDYMIMRNRRRKSEFGLGIENLRDGSLTLVYMTADGVWESAVFPPKSDQSVEGSSWIYDWRPLSVRESKSFKNNTNQEEFVMEAFKKYTKVLWGSECYAN